MILPLVFQSSLKHETGLETVTNGLARATSHRVLSPPKGSTPRYSVPFFQNIGQRIRLSEIRLERKIAQVLSVTGDFTDAPAVPSEVVALRRDDVGATDCKRIVVFQIT